jgi:pilus assembly protein Flp/PilA
MLKTLVKFQVRASERGATAVEYGLLVALIAVIMAVGAKVFGQELNSLFNSVGSSL